LRRCWRRRFDNCQNSRMKNTGHGPLSGPIRIAALP
jgi:hypothetical protein